MLAVHDEPCNTAASNISESHHTYWPISFLPSLRIHAFQWELCVSALTSILRNMSPTTVRRVHANTSPFSSMGFWKKWMMNLRFTTGSYKNTSKLHVRILSFLFRSHFSMISHLSFLICAIVIHGLIVLFETQFTNADEESLMLLFSWLLGHNQGLKLFFNCTSTNSLPISLRICLTACCKYLAYSCRKISFDAVLTIKNKTFIQFQKLYYDYLLENYT